MINNILDFFSDHAPIIQILIFLIGGPLACFINSKFNIWKYSFILALLSFINSIWINYLAYDKPIIYLLGGWEGYIGIEYYISAFDAFMLLITSFIALVSIVYSKNFLIKEISNSKIANYFAIFMVCAAGYMGIVISNDVFNIYVFLEISSIAAYALVACSRSKEASYAAFEYLIIGTIGASFFLIGVGILYSFTGSLNLSIISQVLSGSAPNILVNIAFILIIIGCLFKSGLFPLHLWVPRVYRASPSFFTSFLAGIATKISFLIIVKIIYATKYYQYYGIEINYLFRILGITSIILGGIIANYRKNIKNILSFSSISQMGYILVAFSYNNILGVSSFILFFFNHALSKANLFFIFSIIEHKYKIYNLEQLKELPQKHVALFIPAILSFMSLAGFPFTLGFVAKISIILAFLKENLLWGAGIVLGSIFSLSYSIRVILNIVSDFTFSKNYICFNNEYLVIWLISIINIVLGIGGYYLFLYVEKIAFLLVS